MCYWKNKKNNNNKKRGRDSAFKGDKRHSALHRISVKSKGAELVARKLAGKFPPSTPFPPTTRTKGIDFQPVKIADPAPAMCHFVSLRDLCNHQHAKWIKFSLSLTIYASPPPPLPTISILIYLFLCSPAYDAREFPISHRDAMPAKHRISYFQLCGLFFFFKERKTNFLL